MSAGFTQHSIELSAHSADLHASSLGVLFDRRAGNQSAGEARLRVGEVEQRSQRVSRDVPHILVLVHQGDKQLGRPTVVDRRERLQRNLQASLAGFDCKVLGRLAGHGLGHRVQQLRWAPA